MAYPQKLLNENETVVLDLHPHWWTFFKAVAALVLSTALGIFSMTLDDGNLATFLGWASLLLILGSALWLLQQFVVWTATNFVVTTDRVIYRSGVFAKSGIEIPLERVNNVLFNQSIIERMLGAGDLMIESGGETGQQRFSDIKNPDQVQRLIHAQIGARRSQGFQGTHGGADVASQLEKLEGMLERGTLSQDEFEREKRRLLGG